MRTKLGWALSVLGVLVAILGAVVMVLLGPDSRFTTGPHVIDTDETVVVTAPKVITWADVQVDVLAEVPVRKPIFVGLGNSVDVADFVRRTGRLEVTSFTTPWKLTTRTVDGAANLPGAPTAVDWWIASSAGLGGASISTRLPDETVSLAILSVGSSNLTGLEVTIAYGVKGGFAKGVGLLLLGIGTVWLGLLVRRGRDEDWGEWEDEVEEDVVYVYVDDDGVEHEITAEEAGDFEVVEEVVVEEPAPAVPAVLTAGDRAAAPPDPAPPAEQVLYVYVDEDGVEHEVSEEELAEFEIVDEEDDS